MSRTPVKQPPGRTRRPLEAVFTPDGIFPKASVSASRRRPLCACEGNLSGPGQAGKFRGALTPHPACFPGWYIGRDGWRIRGSELC
jgi:hypothetical protein